MTIEDGIPAESPTDAQVAAANAIRRATATFNELCAQAVRDHGLRVDVERDDISVVLANNPIPSIRVSIYKGI